MHDTENCNRARMRKYGFFDMLKRSVLNRISSGGLALAISCHLAGSLSVAALAYATQVAFAYPAVAAPTAQRNAQGLLSDMRVSLGMIAESYKGNAGARHQSAISVIDGVTQAARANQRLETALAAREGKAVADATNDLSRAVGELQTRYSLTPAQNERAARGIRRLNAAWRAYSSRYILSGSQSKAGEPSRAEIRALRGKVSALERRVSALEDQVAANAALQRQVAQLRRDLAYYDGRPDDARTYQHMLLTLTIASGSFNALAYTTQVYYPTYYPYFVSLDPEFSSWRSYWEGYYDGYYDRGSWGWLDEPMEINDPLIEITNIEVNQEITYQTIYNINNETRIEYESLPQENLENINIAVSPSDTISSEITRERIEDEGDDSNLERPSPIPSENEVKIQSSGNGSDNDRELNRDTYNPQGDRDLLGDARIGNADDNPTRPINRDDIYSSDDQLHEKHDNRDEHVDGDNNSNKIDDEGNFHR